MQSVRNSKLELQNSTALGETTLSSIHGQRERLKSAHRKALDMLNTVGMPNLVLRLAERCAKQSAEHRGVTIEATATVKTVTIDRAMVTVLGGVTIESMATVKTVTIDRAMVTVLMKGDHRGYGHRENRDHSLIYGHGFKEG
ncbi:uncharacterized protein DS421_1g14690 [Arachis hypogaea]|nr:uncharacterized protein DS421_1g14690 [Arachis hypogaea]